MKAVLVTHYGPPEEITVGEIEVPVAGAGQILVRIEAASINPLDLRLPRGDFPHLPVTFPHVPGNDFAGTVAQVGAGVTAYRKGDLIFGHAVPHALRPMAGAKPSLTTGSLAEYAVVEADTPFVAHRPPGLDVVQAAALPTVGLTANALMRTAQPMAGQRVLVVGATGGVGTTLLPLLREAGCHVIATARPGDELDADEIIDYGDYPDNVDIALNLVLMGDELTALENATAGRIYTITLPLPADTKAELVLDLDGRLGGMSEVAPLRATVAATYDLTDGPRAIVDFAREHTVGKLVVVA